MTHRFFLNALQLVQLLHLLLLLLGCCKQSHRFLVCLVLVSLGLFQTEHLFNLLLRVLLVDHLLFRRQLVLFNLLTATLDFQVSLIHLFLTLFAFVLTLALHLVVIFLLLVLKLVIVLGVVTLVVSILILVGLTPSELFIDEFLDLFLLELERVWVFLILLLQIGNEHFLVFLVQLVKV